MAFADARRLKNGRRVFYARYIGPDGRLRSAGAYSTKRDAEKAADTFEREVARGTLADPALGRMTFARYVEDFYWPTARHLELATQAGYRSPLDRHFLPRFGAMAMRTIAPSTVQAWVNEASSSLAPKSVAKYHGILHSIFNQAVIDKVVPANPCANTRLPKVVKKPKRIITPAEFELLLAAIAAAYRVLVLVAIESGMRWGELIALRPCDIDFATHTIVVRRVIVEVSKKISPSGQRYVVKGYPKDDEQRRVEMEAQTCRLIREHMVARGIRDEDLLFTTSVGTPISRNTFRTRVWLPALQQAGLQEGVTFHGLRGAHASWLLAGGADLLVVMERLGHRLISTTQQYLGTLPDSGERALAAFRKIRSPQS